MEFKGTKGGWFGCADATHEGIYHILSESDDFPTLVARTCYAPQGAANAQLISCAPEMLDMLIEIVDKYDKDGHLLNVSPSKIKELINKATTI